MWFRFVIILFLLAILWVLIFPAIATNAFIYLGAGNEPMTIALLKAHTNIVKRSPAHTALCIIYAEARQFDEALRECSQAIESDEYDVMAFYTRGNIERIRGENELAERDLTNAIRLDEAFPGSYFMRGDLRMAARNTQGAIEDFTKFLSLISKALDVDDASQVLNLDDKTFFIFVARYCRGIAFRNLGNEIEASADIDIATRMVGRPVSYPVCGKGLSWGLPRRPFSQYLHEMDIMELSVSQSNAMAKQRKP